MDVHTLEFDGTKIPEFLPEGMTKAELARQCGVTRQAIQDIINGRRKPSADLMVRIVSVLKCSIADLSKNLSSLSANS